MAQAQSCFWHLSQLRRAELVFFIETCSWAGLTLRPEYQWTGISYALAWFYLSSMTPLKWTSTQTRASTSTVSLGGTLSIVSFTFFARWINVLCIMKSDFSVPSSQIIQNGAFGAWELLSSLILLLEFSIH